MTAKSQYKPEYGDIAIDLMREGKSNAEFCAAIGVNRRTVFRWRDPNDNQYKAEFAEKYEHAEMLAEAWWLEQGRLAAMGEIKMNAVFWIFTMKNRFGWADNQNVNQNVNSNVTVQEIPKTERKQRILALLKDNGVKLDGTGKLAELTQH